MFKAIKIFTIVFSFALLLVGCGPSEQEAKNLGFANLAEMKDIQAKGFKTKQDYEAQVAKDEAKAKADNEAREEAERQAQAKARAAAEAQLEATRQAQAGAAIKVFQKTEWIPVWRRSVKYVYIQSVVDEVTVQQVALNRGRCNFSFVQIKYGATNLPTRLEFGDFVKIDLDSPPCDLLEIEVTTNLGTTNYSF